MRSLTFALPLLIALEGAVPDHAQAQLHPLLGVVHDTGGRPLAGAEVVVLSQRRSVVTDGAGRFRIDSLPAGDQRLVVRLIGHLAMRPTVRLPQAPGDTLRVLLVPVPLQLPAIVVESDRPGVRGVVGDTGYHALPFTLVELLGAHLADTTDDRGHFAFEGLKPGQYMLRVSRAGYVARLISVNLTKRGQEYSIFLDQDRPGRFDWANTHEAHGALSELAHRLASESHLNRMTRTELERYGTMALCDIPRLRFRADPSVLMRGTGLMRGASLCAWSADEVELLEWGNDPCREAWKSIADALGINCGPTRGRSFGFSGRQTGMRRAGYVVIWPRS